MYCNKCGNQVEDNAKFCSKCGTPVNQKINDEISKEHKQDVAKDNSEKITNIDVQKEPESAESAIQTKAKAKKVSRKKLTIIISIILVFLIAGLGTGFYIVKAKTDDFRNYIAETEKKAKSYSSLGKYADEYSSLIKEAGKTADSYNIFKYEEEQEKISALFKNVDELKGRIADYEKKYKDIINETEVESKFLFGDYTEKYEEAKTKTEKAFSTLDEEESKAGVDELEGMLADIRTYNEQKAEEYNNKIREMSISGDYFDAEKGFVDNAKKELEEALKDADYVKAEQVFNDFDEQKKRYDRIDKSDYFDNFIQMDVSEDKTVKLYYEDNGNNWNADKFTLLERAKGDKEWRQAEIVGMNQVNGSLSIDLVVDVSGSMQDIFYDMKESVKNFVYNTDNDTELGLSIISDIYRRESEFTDDKNNIVNLVDGLNCYGLTSLYQSLYSSVIYTASQPGSKCVVAFTDGLNEPYGTGYDFTENDVIEAAKRYKIPVYIIALGSQVDSYVLNNIAYSTGGKYFENTSIYDLYSIYEEIYDSQKTIYELTYKSKLSNKKEREVYVNYYDDSNGWGVRSEFAMKPDIILNGYSENSIVDSSNLKSYYTNKKYLAVEEVARLSTIGELQTVINIYCAKAGFKFKPDGDALVLMKQLGIINKNGKKTMAQVTAKLKKDEVLWTNFSTLFNYRYEWLYGVASRLYYNGYTDFDELNEEVHSELGERTGRFVDVLKKIYKKLEDE